MVIDMVRPNLENLPPVEVPQGHRLVAATEFEDPAPMWAHLLDACFDDSAWTAGSLRETFIDQEQYDPDGTFFIMHDNKPVSTAFAWLDDPGATDMGRIHYVGSLPEHRRKGLARAVVVAVMRYFRDNGFQRAFLGTHPALLPAIRLYLSLGFEPAAANAEHRQVWAEVMENLKAEATCARPASGSRR